jgi:hypothetical protein
VVLVHERREIGYVQRAFFCADRASSDGVLSMVGNMGCVGRRSDERRGYV